MSSEKNETPEKPDLNISPPGLTLLRAGTIACKLLLLL